MFYEFILQIYTIQSQVYISIFKTFIHINIYYHIYVNQVSYLQAC